MAINARLTGSNAPQQQRQGLGQGTGPDRGARGRIEAFKVKADGKRVLVKIGHAQRASNRSTGPSGTGTARTRPRYVARVAKTDLTRVTPQLDPGEVIARIGTASSGAGDTQPLAPWWSGGLRVSGCSCRRRPAVAATGGWNRRGPAVHRAIPGDPMPSPRLALAVGRTRCRDRLAGCSGSGDSGDKAPADDVREPSGVETARRS